MGSFLRTVAFVVPAVLALAVPARADVQVSMRNGRVTIIARDATIRQILVEWARVGRTKIVNVERVPGGPVTLELKDVPEADALDVLLRNLSGYIVSPRATLDQADVSVYDSIAVMPSVASTAPRVAAPVNAPAPFSPPPVFNQNEPDDQDNPARQGVAPPQPVRPPIFSTFPTPQTGNPNVQAPRPVLPTARPGAVAAPQSEQNQPPPPIPSPTPPAATSAPGQPTAPVGVSAPGMIAPAPQPGAPQPR